MKEIGGYIELDKYMLPMLHEGAMALNCGRNALAYLIRARQITKIALPKFLCSSVSDVCHKEDVQIKYYSIGNDFLPKDLSIEDDVWLYIVNYYGQINNDVLSMYSNKYKVIVDNAQAYFQKPVEGVDTIYTCRKFFGVADGAILYTDADSNDKYEQDESYERMHFLLGRFERTASEFYGEYSANNSMFNNEPIKYMSKLTLNLLHGIDYDKVKKQRTENFEYLHNELGDINGLSLKIHEGAFMYPLYINNGNEIKKKLQERKIYVPTLWPDVYKICDETETEYQMAENIIPIPVDQRYNVDDMKYIVDEIKSNLIERSNI